MLDLKKILTSLKNNNVKFVIIGGQAAVIHGSSIMTRDFDICYCRDKKNLENIVKALSPFHPYLRGAPQNLPFKFDEQTIKIGLNFTLTTDIGDIDLIGEVEGIGKYEKVIKYSEKIEIYGMHFQVLSINGLLKNKKTLGREKDKIQIKELEALLTIIKKKEKR